VKIRNEGVVSNRAVYLAIGVRCSGHKEIFGIWIEQTERAKFWLRVMSELRNRGVQDILIAVVDGLKGFPEAITSVFPKTVVQTCIVHLIQYSTAVRAVEGTPGGRGNPQVSAETSMIIGQIIGEGSWNSICLRSSTRGF
jgi:transposase-like protein